MRRILLKVLIALGLSVPLTAAATLYLAIDRAPIVRRSVEISPANARRARDILEQISPQRWPNTAQSVTINQQDLDLVVNYLAHFYANGSAWLNLANNKAEVAASIRQPQVPLIFYFNVTATLTSGAPIPRFRQFNVGKVTVPGAVADWVAAWALRRAIGQEAFDAIVQTVKQVEIKNGQLAITYDPASKLRDTLRNALLPASEQHRLRAYQERLAMISSNPNGKGMPFSELLVALFELAQARAAKEDPAAENRAAIVVLAFYINGKSLSTIVPAASEWPRPSAQTVTLLGRNDFAKHFIASAALAISAGGPLSDAAGLRKEIDDSRSGSGFSFADIAADRAGARFGAYAVQHASAAKLQKKLAAGVGENEFMPGTEGLPESMSEAELKRRFGGVGAPDYNRMVGEIERRIAELRLYR